MKQYLKVFIICIVGSIGFWGATALAIKSITKPVVHKAHVVQKVK